MHNGEESLLGTCKQSGQEGGAPMVVAKIGGPTGIEGFCYLRTRMWRRLAPCFAYLGNLVADSVVALAIWRVISFFTNGSVTRRRYRMRDSDFTRVLL